MNSNTLNREIDYRGPAWATEVRNTGDEGSLPWFATPVGRGYYVPGVGGEVDEMLDDRTPMTFDLVNTPNEEIVVQETYIDQVCAADGVHVTFANTDAMRRYARVLIEVADDVERVMGDAR